MYRIRCAEIWGGIGSRDEDVCSAGILASLYSNAYGGGEGGDIYYLSVCESDKLTRVAIADVAGHGAQVSDVSEWLFHILQAHMNDTGCEVPASCAEGRCEDGVCFDISRRDACEPMGTGVPPVSLSGVPPVSLSEIPGNFPPFSGL